MRYKINSIVSRTGIAAAALVLVSSVANATPSVEQYVLPTTLRHLEATVVPKQANQDVLKKIGSGFADAYRVSSGTFIFTAPDRLEYRARAGAFSATQIYTNTTRTTEFGIIHRTDDISKDITKRSTVFTLGLLPQNYLDTMRSVYVGTEPIDGVACDVFMLRYLTDQVNDNRKFEVWVSKERHYVVQKRVWDGGNHEHETIRYKNPIEAMPGVWVPTSAEAYDAQGELGGIVSQEKISAS